MNFPENLKYTADHEWIKVEGENALIGITDYAQKELGDIVFVDVTSEGETLNAGEAFGNIEAVKTVSELLMPAGGEVLELNAALADNPALVNSDPYGEGWIIKVKLTNAAVNSDPYGEGWIIKVKLTNAAEVDALMSAADYKAQIGA